MPDGSLGPLDSIEGEDVIRPFTKPTNPDILQAEGTFGNVIPLDVWQAQIQTEYLFHRVDHKKKGRPTWPLHGAAGRDDALVLSPAVSGGKDADVVVWANSSNHTVFIEVTRDSDTIPAENQPESPFPSSSPDVVEIERGKIAFSGLVIDMPAAASRPNDPKRYFKARAWFDHGLPLDPHLIVH